MQAKAQQSGGMFELLGYLVMFGIMLSLVVDQPTFMNQLASVFLGIVVVAKGYEVAKVRGYISGFTYARERKLLIGYCVALSLMALFGFVTQQLAAWISGLLIFSGCGQAFLAWKQTEPYSAYQTDSLEKSALSLKYWADAAVEPRELKRYMLQMTLFIFGLLFLIWLLFDPFFWQALLVIGTLFMLVGIFQVSREQRELKTQRDVIATTLLGFFASFLCVVFIIAGAITLLMNLALR